ncbi:MAG: hypothetical protein JRI34_02300 [Deltaproteobacteria bacterium]|nr:hypothetical protein [Deltaproteobacteria bacterium]
MSDRGLGLNINKELINKMISRWYSHSDANFQTRIPEMFKGSLMQKKGKCVQSKTYPLMGIMVDYIIEDNCIIQVIHGSSFQGCKN